MKQRNHLAVFAVLLTVALVMFSGCDPIATLGEGTLSIGLETSPRSLTLLPEIDMEIATHTISGSGPEGDFFTEEGFAGAVFERDGLTVGDWELVVDGYNAGGTRIGTAVVELTIRKNQTTSATATLRPLEGTGTFSGTVRWTDSEGVLSDPQVWVTVRDEEGEDIEDISIPTQLEVEGSTASGSADLPAGWYEVTVGLYEGLPSGEALVVWQGVLALRIVAGQTTSGVLEIPESQIRFGTGGVSIVIEEDMDNPFDVFFTVSPEAVSVGDEVTFTSTGTHSDSARYRWYVDGERQDGSSAVFSHTFVEAGEHMVSLLVVDGGAMGGYGVSIEILDKDNTYSTDFSVDPNWTTNNPSRYYWDAGTQSYSTENYTNSGDWALIDTDCSGRSFTVSVDIMPKERDTGDICFGLFDENKNSNSEIGEKAYVIIGGYTPIVYLYAVSQTGTVCSTPSGTMEPYSWHTATITYDATTENISIEVMKNNQSILSWTGVLDGGFSTDLDYLGVSMNGAWVESGRYQKAVIDNVSLEFDL